MNANRTQVAPAQKPWEVLRGFARRRVAAERCELCGQELGPDHRHLVDPAARKLLCACEACAVLFDHQAQTKYRRVPRRTRRLGDFRLADIQWNALEIPIGLAFFFRNSAAERVVGVYPSPGGPTESLLNLDAWDDVVRANPVLESMEPDTEALLANRLGETREYYILPIDQCYRLVGLLRVHWKGFSGGPELWTEIHRYFDQLRQAAE